MAGRTTARRSGAARPAKKAAPRKTSSPRVRRGDAPQARGDLTLYNAKRRFDRTPEPRGERAPPTLPGALSYFIQRHHARSLHYDFRLEWDGTLKSWAVPKGPSLDPGALRLAVQVEDHPLSYGSFEGSIPEGEYGAGQVVLWDRGTWVPREDPGRGLQQGKLHFELRGEKLQGSWVLFRSGRDERHWMLRKLADANAKAGDADAILKRRPESVLAARRDQEGAARMAAPRRDAASAATTSRKAAASRGATHAEAATPPRAAQALPATVQPQLALLSSSPPTDDQWRYEVKYDGYRMLARIGGGKVRIVSRNGGDWTAKLPALAAALGQLEHEAWLDGEVVAFDDAGRSDFQLLQNALDRGHARHAQLVFMAFDLLFLDGTDWRARPWRERVEALRDVLAPLDPSGAVRLSEAVGGDGAAALRKACKLGLEGLIAKRIDAPYVGGRHDAWRKLKCHAEQEFVIVGYTEPTGSREHVGALLLGVHGRNGALRYAGRVGTGFSEDTLATLGKRLASLEVADAPLAPAPRLPGAARVHWVRPELVAQVRFAEWTSAGQVRQAAFQGLREDKEAGDVTREKATTGTGTRSARTTTRRKAPRPVTKAAKVTKSAAAPKSLQAAKSLKATKSSKASKSLKATKSSKASKASKSSKTGRPAKTSKAAAAAKAATPTRSAQAGSPASAARAARSAPTTTATKPRKAVPAATADAQGTAARERTANVAATATVAGIKVTHPERIVYAQPRATKLDVVRYYDAVAPYLFEETARRPVSLMRCPQGVAATRGAAIAQCFFQKHLEHLPAGMRAVRSPNPDIADYVAIERPEALVALAQHGTIEFHTWGARLPKLAQPDRLILDLDPDPALGWPVLIEAALLTRTLLQELGLPALLKTTGGKGLHVVVPLKPERGWDEVKTFARALAQRLVQVGPERFTATSSKAQRPGKIFIDYLRNGEGATFVAAYSLRARAGAPVAMPIDWDELTPKRDLRGEHFNIGNAIARAAESSALWRDADRRAVALTQAMRQRIGAESEAVGK